MSDAELESAIEEAQGRVMIGFKDAYRTDGVDNSGRVLASATAKVAGLALLREANATVNYEFQRMPAVVATVDARSVSDIRHHPNVDYLEPASAGTLHSQTVPWNISRIGADEVWTTTTGSGAKVLILDSGAPINAHRDLFVDVAWRCEYGNEPVYDPLNGHGLRVAGVVAATSNSVDVVGASHGVDLYMANIMFNGSANAAEIACSIDVGRVNAVDVVNMSLSIEAHTGMTDAINGAYNEDDMIFVASVCNNCSVAGYPSSLSNVIAVTAIDSLDVAFSGVPTDPKIELSAPGVDVLTLVHSSYVGLVSGTSFAAPHVTSAAALLRARYPSWTNGMIRTRLRVSATDIGSPGFDNTFGYGRLNVASAMLMDVAISGATSMLINNEGTWTAEVSGGQSPYAYQFWVNGVPSGTSEALLHTPTTTGNLALSLRVTDDNGLIAWAYKNVTVTDCSDPCSE
jgi:subtilisin family serine protease